MVRSYCVNGFTGAVAQMVVALEVGEHEDRAKTWDTMSKVHPGDSLLPHVQLFGLKQTTTDENGWKRLAELAENKMQIPESWGGQEAEVSEDDTQHDGVHHQEPEPFHSLEESSILAVTGEKKNRRHRKEEEYAENRESEWKSQEVIQDEAGQGQAEAGGDENMPAIEEVQKEDWEDGHAKESSDKPIQIESIAHDHQEVAIANPAEDEGAGGVAAIRHEHIHRFEGSLQVQHNQAELHYVASDDGLGNEDEQQVQHDQVELCYVAGDNELGNEEERDDYQSEVEGDYWEEGDQEDWENDEQEDWSGSE